MTTASALVALLFLVAVALTWPVPRLLPRWTALELVPGPALVLWQAVSLSGVFAAIAVAPLALLQLVRRGDAIPSPASNLPLLALGLAVSGVVTARILLQAHQIGTTLRRARREHTRLVDLVGETRALRVDPDRPLTVLDHPTPTAYCIPGRRSRVVLTGGTLRRLPEAELDGVLAHERTHLRQRHDLVLELFTVLHNAVPRRIRSDTGIRQVRLLIELLADRSAVREVGAVPVARALVTLSEGAAPGGTLGVTGSPAVRRLELLADPAPHRLLGAVVLAAAACAVLVPGALAWGALIAWL